MPETSTNAGTTYAPRSPDLSSSSFSNNASNPSYQAPASHEHTEQRTELRGGYAPRSPRISPYSETPPAQHNPDRRTSYVPPTLHSYASKSPEVVNFQRRHSAYIPPTDLPSLNTNFTEQGSAYISPAYTRPQAGFFSTSEPPSHQSYRSGYSIPQSALTYQPPINSLQHSQSLPPTTQNEFKPPYMRDLKLEDPNTPQLHSRPQKMEIDNGVKMENLNGDAPISLGGPARGASKGIEVRTKFPVARIKRIMQADEEVGKVAQVTPVVVCKSALVSLYFQARMLIVVVFSQSARTLHDLPCYQIRRSRSRGKLQEGNSRAS